jgi:hypothetical protein
MALLTALASLSANGSNLVSPHLSHSITNVFALIFFSFAQGRAPYQG